MQRLLHCALKVSVQGFAFRVSGFGFGLFGLGFALRTTSKNARQGESGGGWVEEKEVGRRGGRERASEREREREA